MKSWRHREAKSLKNGPAGRTEQTQATGSKSVLLPISSTASHVLSANVCVLQLCFRKVLFGRGSGAKAILGGRTRRIQVQRDSRAYVRGRGQPGLEEGK